MIISLTKMIELNFRPANKLQFRHIDRCRARLVEMSLGAAGYLVGFHDLMGDIKLIKFAASCNGLEFGYM